jgi:dienelactone hydrolase
MASGCCHQAEGDGPFPVVVYLHGCAGRTPDSYRWARFLADHGFAVVLPDSMARAGRRSICDPGTRSAPRADAIYDLRVEEAQYALARVKEAPWAIPGRVFLMGHSEGGIAVASFDAAGFRGSIISGWTCAFGLFTKGPLLILNHEQDPWMAGNRSRRCGVKGEIIVPGQGHENSESPMARDASLTFLTGLVR